MRSLSDLFARPAEDPLLAVVEEFNQGDAAHALERLKPHLTVDAPTLAARFVLAMTAWRLERFDWALSILRACHQDASENGAIADTLASLEAQLGHLDESLYLAKLGSAYGVDPAWMRFVPAAYPSFDRAFLSIVERPLLGAARRARAQGKLETAIEKARQHVAIEPQDGEGRCFGAECLMLAGIASLAAESLSALDGAVTVTPRQASLYARALTGIGERERALRWHDRATTAAPDDASIAAAYIADAVFLGFPEQEIAGLAEGWASRFALERKPARKWGGQKRVIAYLVSAFIDPQDAAAVAAIAQAHDRDTFAVLGFGCGEQTAEQNALLIGSFTKWRDVNALDPATLARILSGESVDVVVDAGGFAAPTQLQALSRCTTAIRVSWLGNPTGLAAPFYDALLPASDYPVSISTERQAIAHEGIAFGADVTIAQLDQETVRLWSLLLEAVSGSKLVLRMRDMSQPASVARLIAAFGNEVAARIDLRAADTNEDFYAAVDIGLLPLHAASPRAAAEALGNGVPVVALQGTPYAALLMGQGMEVAADHLDYRRRALALARAPQQRCAVPAITGAHALAKKLEGFAALLPQAGGAGRAA